MFAYRHKETGKWLIYNERTTHTGTRHHIAWCDDLEFAYVGLLSHFDLRKLQLIDMLDRVQVTVKRIVTIVNE